MRDPAFRCFFVLGTLLAAFGAEAEESDHLRIDYPGTTVDAFSGMEGTTLPAPGEFLLNLGSTYRANPWGSGADDGDVDHLATLEMGIVTGVPDSAAISAVISYAVLQQGPEGVSAYGIGDGMVNLHLNLLENAKGGAGVCLLTGMGFPSGSPSGQLGSGMWSVVPAVAADFKLFMIQIAANLGMRFFSPARGDGQSGSDLLWKAGLKVAAIEDILVPYVYVAGDVGMAGGYGDAVHGDLGNKFTLSDEISLDVFGGIGFCDGCATSDWRVGIMFRWYPQIGDLDEDNISGSRDACPYLPEDYDGFQDQDGCPDPDNDQDAVPDDEDACPNEYGEGDDGCPVSPPREGSG